PTGGDAALRHVSPRQRRLVQPLPTGTSRAGEQRPRPHRGDADFAQGVATPQPAAAACGAGQPGRRGVGHSPAPVGRGRGRVLSGGIFMAEELKPKPDASKSAQRKSTDERKQQIEQAKSRLAESEGAGQNRNPIVLDETYSELRENNRVVMRHTIALNIDNFRAAPEDFASRPERTFPPLL